MRTTSWATTVAIGAVAASLAMTATANVAAVADSDPTHLSDPANNSEQPPTMVPPAAISQPPSDRPNSDQKSAALPPGVTAKNNGRYQALALPHDPGTAGDKMMIVDTLTGDVWQWFDSPALSQYIGRSGVTYMGKLKPGKKPGETITFKRFDGLAN